MSKILLVEDDAMLRDVYRTKLLEAGFEVEVAEDGEKALSHLQESVPDAVILDVVLPYKDGWEVLHGLRDMPSCENVPVLMLSNLGQKEEVEKGLALGASKYLIKAHFTPAEIVEELQGLLIS
ncbi:MAG: response regulator [Patescibacteria group bacterium]